MSVDNLIKEIIDRKDIPAGIYNIADDEPLSTTEVVSVLSEALNRKPHLLSISSYIVNYISKIGDVLHLPLNTERLYKLTENFIVSNKKIKNVLKKELPLSAREGILRAARSFNDA